MRSLRFKFKVRGHPEPENTSKLNPKPCKSWSDALALFGCSSKRNCWRSARVTVQEQTELNMLSKGIFQVFKQPRPLGDSNKKN